MTVRAFTAAHNLDCAVGALGTGISGTIAAIVKRGPLGGWHTIHAMHSSGGTPLNQFGFRSTNNRIVLWSPDNTVDGIVWTNLTDWALFVVRKAPGAGVVPRFSIYNFTAGIWTHAAGLSALNNWATSAGGLVRFNWQGNDQFVGRIAARAAWNGLPWASTVAGDAALEAAGLHTSAANWLATSPDAMWLFNQVAVTDPVTDITGNGANQTARTGTTVITDDDPPGFNFSTESGIPYAPAAETETARALTSSKTTTIGTGAETESTRTLASSKTTSTTSATETETVRGFTPAKTATVGRVTETETAAAFGHTTSIIYGHTGETENVRSFSVAKVADVGRAAETEAARTFTAALGYTYGGVSETEQVRGFTAPKTAPYNAAAETETARGFAGPQLADPNPLIVIYDEHPRRHTYTEPGRIHTYQEV